LVLQLLLVRGVLEGKCAGRLLEGRAQRFRQLRIVARNPFGKLGQLLFDSCEASFVAFEGVVLRCFHVAPEQPDHHGEVCEQLRCLRIHA
jgi:hypothetical protein